MIWNLRDDRPAPPMTAFDLVPEWEQARLICTIVADKDFRESRRLYFEEDYADVWEHMSRQRAIYWTPPPKKSEPKPQ
jgi:hypothetical protein